MGDNAFLRELLLLVLLLDSSGQKRE